MVRLDGLIEQYLSALLSVHIGASPARACFMAVTGCRLPEAPKLAGSGAQWNGHGRSRIGIYMVFRRLHDGTKFVHELLRLSVLIAAPQHAIESVIAKHENVRQLIEHEWVHILHIDDSGDLFRRAPGGAYVCL